MPSREHKSQTTYWQKKVISHQLEDGSWGAFHTLHRHSPTPYTTERALQRLACLGATKDTPAIGKAIQYLQALLAKEDHAPVQAESFSDWTALIDLFAASWIRVFEPQNVATHNIAQSWAEVVFDSFRQGSFCELHYRQAFQRVFGLKASKRVWNIESLNVALLLPGYLNASTETAFLHHLMHSEKGLYYAYNQPLLTLPSVFQSVASVRFLYAHTVLAAYPSYRGHSEPMTRWLIQHQENDNQWDFGSKAKDQVLLPLSDSWQNKQNRVDDCTQVVLKYLNQVKNFDTEQRCRLAAI